MLLIKNARIFTPLSASGRGDLWRTATYAPGAMRVENGLIRAIGEERDIVAAARGSEYETVDAQGLLVTPGFVDCHTHPLFYQHRAAEFELRIKGASYEEISKAGGGIRFSVRDLRQASEEALLHVLLARLDSFLAHGTTTIEAKSGYGLSVESELKSLTVLQQGASRHAMDIVPTFLGAHEIPDEYRDKREAYIRLLVEEMIPQVVEQKLARFIDVFCEQHVFSARESVQVLLAGKEAGLIPKIHADQLHSSGGAEVAIEVGAASADHLEHAPAALDEALLRTGVVPVMLPGADFFLASPVYGPARRMIAAGLAVAIATDFNPGTCMCESMPMMLTLAALHLKMTPGECIVASTLHAARAIAMDHLVGSLEPGKQADFILWNAEAESEIPYHFGVNLVQQVFKKGVSVHENGKMTTLAGGLC